MTKSTIFQPETFVAIHSVPRSGSSWLGQALNSSPNVIYKFQPLFSYAFKDYLNPNSTRNEIRQFFMEIVVKEDEFLDQTRAIRNGIYPRFKKKRISHVVYKEVRYHHILENMLETAPEVKVIGLVRSPLGMLASWKSAAREFNPDWNFSTEWRSGVSKNRGRPEEFYGFDAWCKVARMFLDFQQRYHDQFRLIRYQDLIDDTMGSIKELFLFCKIPWSNQTESFLFESRTSRRDDPYSVYHDRIRDDQWKNVLPEDIVNTVVDELSSTPLQVFLDL